MYFFPDLFIYSLLKAFLEVPMSVNPSLTHNCHANKADLISCDV